MAMPQALIVERDGTAVAVLDDPRLDDMFWFAWRINPLSEDPEQRAAVSSDAFWADAMLDRTVFRGKASGEVAGGFWAGSQPVRDGRLILRGAYVPAAVKPTRNPVLWLWLLIGGGGAFWRSRAEGPAGKAK
jgi:hypothetical protein